MDIRNGGSGCVIWNGDIFDVRNFPNGGQDLYVRLAAADLVDKRTKNGKIIGLSIGVTIILLLLCFIIFRFWKKKQKRSIAIQTPIVDQGRMEDSLMTELAITSRRYISRENKTNDDLELSLMEFEVGRLLDGKEIAVKRLSKMSLQGTDEFKNEVRLIARLQHINLVRLLGCCVDKGEKMLIYEYLENLSLDSHIFDITRRSSLNWEMRFDITNGMLEDLYSSPRLTFGVLLLEIISGKKNNGFYNSTVTLISSASCGGTGRKENG
ncbi:Receptor-like serine/threonine-protein kinase SD1-6 [Raphanus sativus]|nr:Receptor-like serine/threonine-protein kinase SD1-6 [Raphanus sativus]